MGGEEGRKKEEKPTPPRGLTNLMSNYVYVYDKAREFG